MSNDGCGTFYFLGGGIQCLHELFAGGHIKTITREVTRDGVEFYIWTDKLKKQTKGRYAGKYKLFGSRSRLGDREQVIIALELAEKYKNQVERVRL